MPVCPCVSVCTSIEKMSIRNWLNLSAIRVMANRRNWQTHIDSDWMTRGLKIRNSLGCKGCCANTNSLTYLPTYLPSSLIIAVYHALSVGRRKYSVPVLISCHAPQPIHNTQLTWRRSVLPSEMNTSALQLQDQVLTITNSSRYYQKRLHQIQSLLSYQLLIK